jgi:RNA polymerase sigma factor (sigma-70 family)
MDQPIVKTFLNIEENYTLFKKTIYTPTRDNRETLDKSFKTFYYKIRLIKYMSTLIHYSSIEFDKKYRNNQRRYPLVLDQALNPHEEKSTTILDRFITESCFDFWGLILKEKGTKDIIDHLECPNLISAIDKLNPKQKLILQYKYIDCLKNKEIAKIFNTSPQNISKVNKTALKKIKHSMKDVKKRIGES